MRFLQFGFSGTFSRCATPPKQPNSPNIRNRGEGLTIQDSSHDDLPQGFRIVSVDGVSIVDMNQTDVRKCFPVSPADCVITVCLESDLMGMNETNPVVRIPMWKEAWRVPSRSTTPLNVQHQVFVLACT